MELEQGLEKPVWAPETQEGDTRQWLAGGMGEAGRREAPGWAAAFPSVLAVMLSRMGWGVAGAGWWTRSGEITHFISGLLRMVLQSIKTNMWAIGPWLWSS